MAKKDFVLRSQDYLKAKQNATVNNMPHEEERLSARESNATLREDLLDKYESGAAPGNLLSEPVVSEPKHRPEQSTKVVAALGPTKTQMHWTQTLSLQREQV